MRKQTKTKVKTLIIFTINLCIYGRVLCVCFFSAVNVVIIVDITANLGMNL